jgi:hypothetical protein
MTLVILQARTSQTGHLVMKQLPTRYLVCLNTQTRGTYSHLFSRQIDRDTIIHLSTSDVQSRPYRIRWPSETKKNSRHSQRRGYDADKIHGGTRRCIFRCSHKIRLTGNRTARASAGGSQGFEWRAAGVTSVSCWCFGRGRVLNRIDRISGHAPKKMEWASDVMKSAKELVGGLQLLPG